MIARVIVAVVVFCIGGLATSSVSCAAESAGFDKHAAPNHGGANVGNASSKNIFGLAARAASEMTGPAPQAANPFLTPQSATRLPSLPPTSEGAPPLETKPVNPFAPMKDENLTNAGEEEGADKSDHGPTSPADFPARDPSPGIGVVGKEAEASASVADTIEITTTAYKSTLKKFSEFNGEKNLTNLTALFDAAPGDNLKQIPAISLSDGKSSLKIFISESPELTQHTSSFVLKGAKFVSLNRENGTTLALEVLPESGVYDASLVILYKDKGVEFPLTVAPPIKPACANNGEIGDADFIAYLKAVANENNSCFDLNNDGIRNYIDDYIFVANYLVGQKMIRDKSDAEPR